MALTGNMNVANRVSPQSREIVGQSNAVTLDHILEMYRKDNDRRLTLLEEMER